MSLTDTKVRLIINQLADPGTAHAAAHVLAEEAKRRGKLVADLVAESLAPAQASAPPPTAPAPNFSDVDVHDARIDVAIGKRINFNAYGLRAEILGETDKAWLARTPAGGESWLSKKPMPASRRGCGRENHFCAALLVSSEERLPDRNDDEALGISGGPVSRR